MSLGGLPAHGSADVQTDISAVELNRSLDPALFTRPASAAADGAAANAGG